MRYNDLGWVSDWYVREDTLRQACVELVNFLCRQPISLCWGDGTHSSTARRKSLTSLKADVVSKTAPVSAKKLLVYFCRGVLAAIGSLSVSRRERSTREPTRIRRSSARP